MGIAVLSGVVASLHTVTLDALTTNTSKANKWESHTSGTTTPVNGHGVDASIPTRFIACVSREESAAKLRATFAALTQEVEVVAQRNVEAVQQSDVILLGCKPQAAHAILAEQGMKEALEGKLLISILAGVTIVQMTDWVSPSTRVVRAMPNTPCKVRLISVLEILFH